MNKELQKTDSYAEETDIEKRKQQTKLSTVTKDLRDIKNKCMKDFLSSLTAPENTDYPLWKSTKKLEISRQQCLSIKDKQGKWVNGEEVIKISSLFLLIIKFRY